MNRPAPINAPEQRERREIRRAGIRIGTWMPLCLVAAATATGTFPGNEIIFGAAAAVGSAVSLYAAFLVVFRLRQFRITWILADGLLLGYSLGSFNTVVRLALQGSTVAVQFARPQADLSIALAATLAVSAFLFFVGGAAEKAVRIDPSILNRSDLVFVWLGLATVLAAFATGTVGYMGTVADDQHRVSMLGEIAGLWAPALPAATVFLFPKCTKGLSRAACWLLLLATLVCLVPQGRRTLLYGALLAFVAFGRTGGVGVPVWKRILPIIAALPLLYVGNMFFYAMRVSAWQAGSARLSLSELTTNAAGILRGGHDSTFERQIDENLRDRTFVLRYFSDLLAASWTHRPLYGRDLLYCIRTAVPSVLDPDKEDVRQIGMEENLVNPEFGLNPIDEANSIITTGVSDFGVVGIFLYPLALSLAISAFVRRVAQNVPPIVNAMAVLAALDIMWQSEMSASVYLTLCRDLLVLALPLTIFKIWQQTARIAKPASRRVGILARKELPSCSQHA